MPNMFFEEVTEYRATIYPGNGDKKASMFLTSANLNIYISFYKEGTQLRENQSPIIQGRQHIYMNFHYNDYFNMVDLLRNEKPINIFYRDDIKIGYLSTSMEPVGEHELDTNP